MKLKTFFALFFLAWVPRAAFFFIRGYEDPTWSHYWNLSSGLLKYGTFGYSGEQVTNIEPGYPVFLAFARMVTGGNISAVFLLQTAVAALGAPLMHVLSRQAGLGPRVSFISGIIFAFYPYLIGQSAEVIEVPLFTLLLMASAVCWLRARQSPGWIPAVVCGLIMGLTVLTRSMVLPAFFTGILFFAFQSRWRTFFLAGVLAFAVAAPWFARNHSIDGSFVPPRSGWNLLQAHSPYSKKIIPEYNPDILDAYVSKLMKEERPDLYDAEERPTLGREVDDFFTKKAWAYMRAHPWETVSSRILNVFYLYYPRIVPFRSMDRNTRIEFTGPEDFRIEGIPRRPAGFELAYTLTYTPVFLLACAGVYIRRRSWKGDLIFYLILLNFTAVYAFYWPATRLRSPMDFVLILFAAAAAERLIRKTPCLSSSAA